MKKILVFLFVLPLFWACDKSVDCNIDHELIKKLSAQIKELEKQLEDVNTKQQKEIYQMQIDELNEQIEEELAKCSDIVN